MISPLGLWSPQSRCRILGAIQAAINCGMRKQRNDGNQIGRPVSQSRDRRDGHDAKPEENAIEITFNQVSVLSVGRSSSLTPFQDVAKTGAVKFKADLEYSTRIELTKRHGRAAL
jgi:hypothetical protein